MKILSRRSISTHAWCHLLLFHQRMFMLLHLKQSMTMNCCASSPLGTSTKQQSMWILVRGSSLRKIHSFLCPSTSPSLRFTILVMALGSRLVDPPFLQSARQDSDRHSAMDFGSPGDLHSFRFMRKNYMFQQIFSRSLSILLPGRIGRSVSWFLRFTALSAANFVAHKSLQKLTEWRTNLKNIPD